MIYITRGGIIFHLVRNGGHCTKCNTIIESNEIYEKVICKCGLCYVSGGVGTRWENYGHPDFWVSLVQWQDVSSRILYFTEELPLT